jgi:hypothetical protein
MLTNRFNYGDLIYDSYDREYYIVTMPESWNNRRPESPFEPDDRYEQVVVWGTRKVDDVPRINLRTNVNKFLKRNDLHKYYVFILSDTRLNNLKLIKPSSIKQQSHLPSWF